jgi:hypothetical protein
MGERKKDFEWRYQPPNGSDKAIMLTYIQNRELHPSQDKTALIVNALTSFYMPLALLSQGNEDSTHLELVTMDCLRALVNQFNYLCAVLRIEPQRVGGFWSGVQHQITPPSSASEVETGNDEIEDFDPNEWNLAGITTDSETFEFSN